MFPLTGYGHGYDKKSCGRLDLDGIIGLGAKIMTDLSRNELPNLKTMIQARSLLRGCHAGCSVTMYNEKALNLVQTWLPDFSAICHYAKFGMASVLKGRSVVPIRGRKIDSYLGHGAQSIA